MAHGQPELARLPPIQGCARLSSCLSVLATISIVDGTVLAAWLLKPDSGPEAVMIMWPGEPTSVSPRHYGDVLARVTRLLANSSTELAAIKAGRR